MEHGFIARLKGGWTGVNGLLRGGLAGGMLLSLVSQAAPVNLPVLPAGCEYTQHTLTPLDGVYHLAVSTPLYSSINGEAVPVLSVGVACPALTTPLPLAFNLTGSPEWTGPGRDILPTSVSGVGVRLSFEPQYRGGDAQGCQAGDIARAGLMGGGATGMGCVLPASAQPQRVEMTLRAQLVKIGQETPLAFSGAVSLVGADLVVSLAQQPTAVPPWLLPSLYTDPSCTLFTPPHPVIHFEAVELPADRRQVSRLETNAHPVDIGVRCLPLLDNDPDSYRVDITFDGPSRAGTDNVVATSRRDVGVVLLPTGLDSLQATAREGLALRQPLPLTPVAALSDLSGRYFARRFLVGLNYYPEATVQAGGPFEAVVTYTITLNH
ncbi:TPA: hypothetical protein ACQ39K_004733 [Yersinia enterocolitica]